VAFFSGPLYATKDPATGELKGVAMDLGRELARRIGVPYQPVVYADPAATLAGPRSSERDVPLMGIHPERAAVLDFSAPCMDVEQGFLVRAGFPVGCAASEVDRPGTRVAVVEGTSADVRLSGSLKVATLLRTKSIRDLDAAFDAGRAAVIAATKAPLFERSAQRAGTRVLDGRFLVEPHGNGRPEGTRSSGLVLRRPVRRRGEGGARNRQVGHREGGPAWRDGGSPQVMGQPPQPTACPSQDRGAHAAMALAPDGRTAGATRTVMGRWPSEATVTRRCSPPSGHSSR
jgi:polar amino acid transport system substrate-binding protein